jgi:hypothetical protein
VVLVDPNDDATIIKSMIADVRGAARSIGREIEVFYTGNVEDIGTAFAAASFPASGRRSQRWPRSVGCRHSISSVTLPTLAD